MHLWKATFRVVILSRLPMLIIGYNHIFIDCFQVDHGYLVPQIATANYRKPYFCSNRLQRPFKKYDQVPMIDLKTIDENMIIADN
jgi:hypothetical protein